MQCLNTDIGHISTADALNEETEGKIGFQPLYSLVKRANCSHLCNPVSLIKN